MTVGDVLGEALDLYRRFFGRFVLTAAAVFVFVDLLAAIAADARAGANAGVALFWGVIALVVAVIGSFWVQGALVAAVRDVRDGKADSSVGDLYDAVRPRLPALIAAGILAGIGIAIGLLLLIVPGLLLLTRWVLIVPVIVLEGRVAGESFGRSTELVRGHGWKVLGVIVVTLLASTIARAVFVAVFTPLPLFVQNWIGGLVADALTAPFVALAWTVTYYRLRGADEAGEPGPVPA